MKTRPLLFIIFFLSLSLNIFGQAETNIEIIYKLINSSISETGSFISKDATINLSITTPQLLDVLQPRITKSFLDAGYKLKSSNESETVVRYNLVFAKAEYKNPFTDGLFGGVLIEREITINGMLTATKSNKIVTPVEFTRTIKDTVHVNDISKIENQSLPFTQSQIPSMPLLSNLWEPIVVVGTLIVTVILLFTVRSK